MNREELKKILTTDVPSFEGKDIWIWGAGNTARLYQEGMKRLFKEGFSVKGYCDNNPEKYEVQKEFDSFPIISPKELEIMENVIVLICTSVSKVCASIGEQLTAMNKEWYSIDEAIMKNHSEQIMKCYDLLDDEMSKEIYATVILFRMKGGKLQCKPSSDDRFYAIEPFASKNVGEVYIDCGAYVGDTVEKYIWRREGVFKKIYAFEPNKHSFSAMQERLVRLKKEWNLKDESISIYSYGVGDKEMCGKFEYYDTDHGLSSKFVDEAIEGEEGKIISLDTFIDTPYSFIKADIEGFEYKMLCGAKEGIKKWKPLLAIAICHNAPDIYDIPLLIKEICPEYKIAIRHHSYGWEDTVVYAYID